MLGVLEEGKERRVSSAANREERSQKERDEGRLREVDEGEVIAPKPSVKYTIVQIPTC